MSKIYDIRDVDLAARFREIEAQRPQAIQRGIASAVLLGAEVVARSAPKDLGTLKQSVRGVVTSPGGYVLVDAPHAGILERGSRPHWAPIEPLLAWARRHSSSESEARGLAYGTQIKIAKEGTAPTWFVRKTISKQRKILKAEVERELQAGP